MNEIEELWNKLPTWAKWAIPIGGLVMIILIWAPWKNASKSSSGTTLITPMGLNSSGQSVVPSVATTTSSSPVSSTTSSSPVSSTTSSSNVIPNVFQSQMSGTQFTTATSSATGQERAAALATSEPTSLPTVSAGRVGALKAQAQEGAIQSVNSSGKVTQYASGIAGMTGNNVPILNTHASQAQQVSALSRYSGISIPGVSASKVAYLQQLARQGKLAGVGANGNPILK
jgi:hypothetical protein